MHAAAHRNEPQESDAQNHSLSLHYRQRVYTTASFVNCPLFFFSLFLFIIYTFRSYPESSLFQLPLFLTFLLNKQHVIIIYVTTTHECTDLFSSECFGKFTLTRLDYRHAAVAILKLSLRMLSICSKHKVVHKIFVACYFQVEITQAWCVFDITLTGYYRRFEKYSL